MGLSNLASMLLWHIAKRNNGSAVQRGALRQSGSFKMKVGEINAALNELIAEGLIISSYGKPVAPGRAPTFYTATEKALAGEIKRPRRGKPRTDGNDVTSARLPAELRRQLEEAADRNDVSLAVEIITRLKASFKREKKHAVA